MSTHHTAVIIGGGPAGSAAAHTLASHGIDTALIDKAHFPRDKLCGGLLTLRSQKIYSRIFAAPWDPVIDYTARGVKFFHRTKLLNEVGNASELFFTRRLDFDHFLLNQAIAQGTRLYPGESVIALDLAGKTCRLRSGATFTFDYLIGADGVNSLVGKTLFGKAFNPARIAFALEMEVDRAQCAAPVGDPEIIFGVARWGYGWVFPKKDTLTVGIGGLHAKNPELKKMFHEFLAARFGAIPEGRIKGHHLPFGDYRKTPGRGNVLLCGDAAGLVEPITGEGIAFAMQSGQYAALAIIEAAHGGRDALPCYQTRYREITRDFDHANRLRHLLFPEACERLFLKVLPRSRTLPRKHLELMADKLQYGEYFRDLVFRILKTVAKRATHRETNIPARATAMSHKHEHLIRAIFQDPISGNIHWREIESLILHLGASMEPITGARYRVVLNGVEGILHHPHHSNVFSKQDIKNLRQYLASARVTPSLYEEGGKD